MTKSEYATQLDTYTYKQLRAECKKLGLGSCGSRAVLRKRLIGKHIKSSKNLKSLRDKVDGVSEYPSSSSEEEEVATASRPDSNQKEDEEVVATASRPDSNEKEDEEEVTTASRPDGIRLNTPSIFSGPFIGPLLEGEVADSNQNLPEWLLYKNSADIAPAFWRRSKRSA